jgi:hypothetical protein
MNISHNNNQRTTIPALLLLSTSLFLPCAVFAAPPSSTYATQTDLNTEITNRQNGDNNEATTRANVDTTLGGQISAEATARAAADTTLQGNINTEAANRGQADTSLGTQISSEASLAQQPIPLYKATLTLRRLPGARPIPR